MHRGSGRGATQTGGSPYHAYRAYDDQKPQQNGRLVVGAGTPTLKNGYQQTPDATLTEGIEGPTNFGTLTVAGPATLDGTLHVLLDNGYVPSPGDSFTFLTATPGSLAGTFAGSPDPTYPGGVWQLQYNNAAGTVTLVAAVPEPASAGALGAMGLAVAGLTRRCRSKSKAAASRPYGVE